jgi:elongation factor Ts
MVKQLREQTGAGIMDCKRALQETSGDLAKAAEILRQQGLAKAEKKAGRAAAQGLVEPYIHAGGRIGAIVELNCETDFVARTDAFKTLCHDIAMHVAASAPKYLSIDDIAEGDYAKLESDFGDRDTAIKAVVLLEQPFIKDPKQTIGDLVKAAIGKLGENIVVRRFARFELGEELGKTEA